jgi:hypothetical protein
MDLFLVRGAIEGKKGSHPMRDAESQQKQVLAEWVWQIFASNNHHRSRILCNKRQERGHGFFLLQIQLRPALLYSSRERKGLAANECWTPSTNASHALPQHIWLMTRFGIVTRCKQRSRCYAVSFTSSFSSRVNPPKNRFFKQINSHIYLLCLLHVT